MKAKSRATWSELGALTTAGTVAATIFCCLPFATGIIGAGVAAVGAQFAPFQSYMMGTSVAFLAFGFYRAYRREPSCTTDACAPSVMRGRILPITIFPIAIFLITVISVVIVPINPLQPVHEAMRPRRVSKRTHDVAPRIDANHLCADRALHIKTGVLSMSCSKKTVWVDGEADRVRLIVAVHTDDIASGVHVPR